MKPQSLKEYIEHKQLKEDYVPPKPREANDEERQAIIQAVGPEIEDGHLEDAAVAVFDGYSSDTPGYQGKLAVVVWPGGPYLHEVFTIRGNKAEKVHIDESLI